MRHTSKIVGLGIVGGLIISAGLLVAVTSADEVNGTISNGIDQGLSVALPCNPASVSNGNVNVTTCEISCNAGYDKSGTSCILHQSSGGGGGGGGGAVMDTCPNGDFSTSHYDGICTAPATTENQSTETQTGVVGSLVGSPFSTELNNAYTYAYHLGITTMPTIQTANMEGLLIRSHLAKMMVNYVVNVLKKQPDTTKACTFNDIGDQTSELQSYIKLSCQLGIMGINPDGTAKPDFIPNTIVTRAEFGTVLSRTLWGNKYNDGKLYYTNHLIALKALNIMNTIADPEHTKELRGYVMLMLMRAEK